MYGCIVRYAFSLTNIFSTYVNRYSDRIIYAKRIGKKRFYVEKLPQCVWYELLTQCVCGMGWEDNAMDQTYIYIVEMRL